MLLRDGLLRPRLEPLERLVCPVRLRAVRRGGRGGALLRRALFVVRLGMGKVGARMRKTTKGHAIESSQAKANVRATRRKERERMLSAARREALRLEWIDYYCRLARAHESLAQEYKKKATELRERRGIRCRKAA